MAESSSFFNSVSGDRVYAADRFAQYFASFIGNGVFPNPSTGLQATTNSAMTIKLPTGKAWINGYFYYNSSDLALTIDTADGVLHRKDNVVIRWDLTNRSITAVVVKGTPGSSPSAPAVVRTAEQYDLKVAEVYIAAGTTTITQGMIADTRLDNTVCGIVTQTVTTISTTTLYNQIQADLTTFKSVNEADFAAWLQTMKDIPPEDAAAYLQGQINAINDSKGTANGIATLDADGHVPKEQLNLNFVGHLIVHVASSDSGSVDGTKVRIRNEQLGSNYV
ncbi:MAG: hypothetical protein M0R51_06790, partial [Clostridia bacterium]|nr:hypothetical protein [Clostridia bacterium]